MTATLPATDTVPPAAPANVKFLVVFDESAETDTSRPASTVPPIQACALL